MRDRQREVRVREETRQKQGGQRQPAAEEERPRAPLTLHQADQAVAEGDVLQIHPSQADAEVVEEHSLHFCAKVVRMTIAPF